MERERELICIKCPKGCRIAARLGEAGEVLSLTGNSCPQGAAYAEKELTEPTRMITGTVPVEGGDRRVLPVRLSGEIPKARIFDVMDAIHACRAQAPVRAGDVLIADVCGLGVDVTAAAEVEMETAAAEVEAETAAAETVVAEA